MLRMKSSLLRRNILAAGVGAASGQVVVLAFSPLITRIYSPEVFGLQGLFLSLISVLGPIVTLRYPMAIVVARNSDEAQWLSRLSLMIAFCISVLFGFILLFAQKQVSALLGTEPLGHLIWFLPLALFCVAVQDVADFSTARLGAFRVVAIVTVAQAVVTNLARVLAGLVAPVAGSLVVVTSIAPALQALMLAIGTRKLRHSSPPLLRDEALTLLKAHQEFPIFRMPNDVLNAASQSVPVILLAALFSPAAAGLYVVARSVVNLPTNIIGIAIGNVLYTRFADLAREGKVLLPLLIRSTFALLAIAPITLGLAWFAPPVFAFAFGEEWREAGLYARWMTLWITMATANVPAARILPVIKRQGLSLIFNIALLISRILSIQCAYWLSQSALTAVAWFSVVSAVLIVIQIVIFTLYTASYDRGRKYVETE